MNLFNDIRSLVIDSLNALTADGTLPEGLSFDNVAVEPPRDPAHGDMATNAAMVLAKPAKKKPRDIAEALAAHLAQDDRITSAEVAGPGFLNLRLAPSVWQGVLGSVLADGTAYGKSELGQGKRVNVEYVSANPTGPLHVGHTRGAVFGDALASLLAYAGYDVTREYYINDGGGQVDVLARSVYLRYLEAHGQEVAFEDGTYPGDYLIEVGQALKDKVGDAYVGKGEEVWLQEVRNFATDAMMDLIREDLKLLGIEMDVFFSEKSLYGTGKIEAALESLDAKGLIYQGVLEPPKGKKPEDWEPREQTLFKSTEHGDDVDRPVKKSDGAWTYFAPDIAYHYDKVERGFDELIDIFGADHGGYVKRMKAAVSALSDGKVPLDIKLCQLVKLFKDGQEFKMSKRAGTFVTLRDVVEAVGPDVTRFMLLTRKNDQGFDFDLDKALEQSKDNPVFYVQYANARICSTLRKAEEAGIASDDAALADADLSLLAAPAQLSVARKLAEWPRLVEIAARSNEPHRVAFYLYDLASDLHGLYHLGKSDKSLRFVNESSQSATHANLALARAVSIVISAGLGILGVTPAEEMR
ncbi:MULTISPECIES: arginine--tRNA ligase [Rhodobacterales]|jgi:arginyl-tRNA synthetase|uniref:arginine--tRNA ligase n=1 Tax=Rhodobacterales TaxID=204455 RepID=UPI00237F6FD6|nr:arginine--tRNA ligase [Phaeobacter gallaeciensis]MDE4096080.1 arginine--tRNA ligase [Phaeobacter gallaeciensis]MDE4104891.1 arginine--tRNA ligase [Phaeobacter gallaeciensis]MDE4109347.1 arginine--tRNA ligase [Phaeobacter gallaeciensis]MDE4113815.1 arginine--tRNA ligase [Phaeobacter gallaeciensis]MDE4118282.1 arginine--tRNA ligase [Phaeobacter gallaeciensis]